MLVAGLRGVLLKAAVIALLVFSLALNIHSHIWNSELKRRCELFAGLSGWSESSGTAVFLVSAGIEQQRRQTEIFDIGKGIVTKKVHTDREIQAEAIRYLEGITGMYVKVDAIPQKGYIVRIPLSPPVKLCSQWVNDYGIYAVDEVFVIFPEQEKPYLLILDDSRRPFFYNFAGNTDELLANLESR